MGQQLRLIYRMKRFLAFDLNYDLAIHDQISSKSAFQFYALINQRNCPLSLYMKPHLLEFVSQARLVRRLKKARPQSAVNLDRRSNNVRSDVSPRHGSNLHRSLYPPLHQNRIGTFEENSAHFPKRNSKP